MSRPEHSWREFYKPHEAAEFFHDYSSKKQLDELRDDIDEQQVILDPIHTASVFGKTFVIDGISRLDAVEATGRPTVDEKGDWMGMVKDHVVHHPGKTDDEVWDLVISLNHTRRHYTDKQRSVIAAELAKRFAPETGDKGINLGSQNNSKRGPGRPSKGITKATEKAADMMNVPVDSVRQIRRLEKKAPDKLKEVKTGKLSPSKAVSQLREAKQKQRELGRNKKEKSLENRTYRSYQQVLARFKRNDYPQVKRYLRTFLELQLPNQELAARVWQRYRFLFGKYSKTGEWKEAKKALLELLPEEGAK